ncbi:MAG: class I SAM-dependent methyltransferase [Bdellovibrionia bacterium]
MSLRTPIVALFTLLLATANSVQLSFAQQSDFARCLSDTLTRLEKNDYNTERGLKDYDRAFLSALSPKLRALVLKDGHWLDAGAGQARAISEFVRLQQAKKEPVPRITALAYKADPDAARNYQSLSQKVGGQKLKLLQGRFLEQIPKSEIGATDLITDVYGPFAYSQNLDQVLNQYLELLKPGGSAMIAYDQAGTTFIRTRSGQSLNVLKWLKSLGRKDLLKVEHRSDHSGDDEHVIITRLGTDEIKVPRLKLVYLKDSAPPRRIFVEEGAQLNDKDRNLIIQGFEYKGFH